MDSLLDWIAHMPGPQFLAVYAVTALVSVTLCAWLARSRDSSRQLAPVQVPADPDPYEIAYLRGGEYELLRLILFRLLQQGVLRMLIETNAKSQKDTFIIENSAGTADPVEREIARRSDGHSSKEVLHDVWAKHEVADSCWRYRERFEAEHLLLTPEDRAGHSQIAWIGTMFVGGLAGYKLFAALNSGHTNVVWLVIMAAFTIGILWKVCTLRLTIRARKYLRSLEAAFGQWREQKNLIGEAQLLLLVSIFGVGVLTGTTYGYFQKAFSRGSGSCGSCGSCGGCDGCGGCGGCGD